MKINKKRFFGYLAVVVTVGAAIAAYTAVLSKADAISSISQTIIVRVYSEYPKTTILSPANEEILVGQDHTMTYEWSNVTSIDFVLTKDGEEVARWTDDRGGVDPSEDPVGESSYPLSLETYGEYRLTATANGLIGQSEDSVSFYRLATSVSYVGSEPNGDPRVNIKYDGNVRIIRAQVYDLDGNLISSDPTIIVAPSGGESIEMVLPIPATAKDGKYRVVVEGLDEDYGAISGPSFINFEYTPPIPVPDTGNFTSNINIARSDFLITGLIVFIATAITALFLIYRKKEQ